MKVPLTTNVIPGPQGAAPNPTMLAMAAAELHAQGRLFAVNADDSTKPQANDRRNKQ